MDNGYYMDLTIKIKTKTITEYWIGDRLFSTLHGNIQYQLSVVSKKRIYILGNSFNGRRIRLLLKSLKFKFFVSYQHCCIYSIRILNNATLGKFKIINAKLEIIKKYFIANKRKIIHLLLCFNCQIKRLFSDILNNIYKFFMNKKIINKHLPLLYSLNISFHTNIFMLTCKSL